jgi:hypothetical protein
MQRLYRAGVAEVAAWAARRAREGARLVRDQRRAAIAAAAGEARA